MYARVSVWFAADVGEFQAVNIMILGFLVFFIFTPSRR
jgi:hypothetical protein